MTAAAMLPSSQELAALLPFLAAAEVEELLPYLTTRAVAGGEVLMQAGSSAEFMAFLLAGRLAVKKETSFSGKYILVAVIEPGGMVGELAVVDKGQRSATVMAMEDCRLVVLTSDAMARLLAEKKGVGVTLLKRIIHVQGHRLRQASDRLARIL